MKLTCNYCGKKINEIYFDGNFVVCQRCRAVARVHRAERNGKIRKIMRFFKRVKK